MSAADHLAALVAVPTISATPDPAALGALHDRIRELYPRVRDALEWEAVGEGALLLTWRGGPAAPVVLMAHQDVVPVADQRWTADPFAGRVDSGVVIGRGALDDKGALVAILEAVESLLAEGVEPPGDVHCCFGHDEEVAGSGARAIAALLRDRGARPGLVVDEGGAVVEGVLPGVRGPLAVVGLAEKGVATVRLTARAAGGHASVPPRRSAPGRLAAALLRLERHPQPARTSPVVAGMAAALAPRLVRPLRPIVAARAVRPLLGPALGLVGGTAGALARTTVAVTRVSAGTADNVLAAEATAVLNIRVAPGDRLAEVVERIRRTVKDPDVEVALVDGHEASAVSRGEGPAWERMVAAIAAAYPDALPVPYVMVQASDARWFAHDCDAVYRFLPFAISAEQLAAIHGPDESLDVAALEAGIRFFRALITTP
ncbi:M20/M25/M40 family metallo-hydrolase [Amnibacterium sp.]|uniref:M20/M25/M40 family metallo-hydrolase n=1 Tax=Amnibacterium sp. TaxID=1872496 RepID=UPI00262FB817|nr:M20/M25/M40 family metallo-hydrolase [Amnibacterium sp.]MCU1474315.1 Peptidase [Amnibacterium sp.]